MSHAIDRATALSADNMNLRPGSVTGASTLLAILGGIGLLVSLGIGFAGGEGEVPTGKIVLAAYHAGAMATLGMMLGGLGFTMILHQVNASWAGLVRRQAENLMSLMPIGCLLVVISLALMVLLPSEYSIFSWMDAAHVAGDPVYEHKAVFLNTQFWIGRAVFYMIVWVWLSRSLCNMSYM